MFGNIRAEPEAAGRTRAASQSPERELYWRARVTISHPRRPGNDLLPAGRVGRGSLNPLIFLSAAVKHSGVTAEKGADGERGEQVELLADVVHI